jgi:hypothetical protein
VINREKGRHNSWSLYHLAQPGLARRSAVKLGGPLQANVGGCWKPEAFVILGSYDNQRLGQSRSPVGMRTGAAG